MPKESRWFIVPLSPEAEARRQSRHRSISCDFASCILPFALGLGFFAADPTSAADPPPVKPAVAEETIKRERYLGVVTEPVPEALAAQLKDRLPAGRGLVVQRVLPESPAAKAGIQPFDIIVAADDQPLAAPDQLKELVTATSAERMLRLEVVREAKTRTVDVLPGQRTVSRMIHRHAGDNPAEPVAAADRRHAVEEAAAELPAYSVGVQTRDGRQFQVEVRLSADGADDRLHKAAGTPAEVAARLKSFPPPVRQSVQRQMARIAEDRQTLRTVQFRFQPRRQGKRQVLTASLCKPQSDGATQSFEWQQPMGDGTPSLPLEKLLAAPDFAAQLDGLDPAVRDKIAATLKTAALPAGSLKVESSQ